MEWVYNLAESVINMFMMLPFWWYEIATWFNETKVAFRPFYIIGATQFQKNGYMFDISESITNILFAKGSVSWEDFKDDENVDYIELYISFYGKKRRFILNKYNDLSKLVSNDVMYAMLQYSGEKSSGSYDITELLKEYANISLQDIEYKHIDYNLPDNIVIHDNTSVDLVVSGFKDLDETTFRLRVIGEIAV